MCLAVPGRITQVEGTTAVVDMLGVEVEASLQLVPGAGVGDYVLVHAGFAIEVVDPVEAQITIDIARSLPTEEDYRRDASLVGAATPDGGLA